MLALEKEGEKRVLWEMERVKMRDAAAKPLLTEKEEWLKVADEDGV